MFRFSESAVISVGDGLERLMGKIAVVLLVVWVLAALMGNPEAGSLHPRKVGKPLGNSGGTQADWNTAVASVAG